MTINAFIIKDNQYENVIVLNYGCFDGNELIVMSFQVLHHQHSMF